MWDKIFMMSIIAYLIGMLALLTGEYLLPALGPVTLPVGGSLVGLGGIAAVVSGIILILATPTSRRN